MLRKKKTLDVQVWLSSLLPLPVRLVALELPVHIANERRRKARKDNRNVNHNKEYYFLLGYAIYITNVPQDFWTAQQLSQSYKWRWYIEMIFKSWKSNLTARYHYRERYANELTVETHFYLLLLYTCLIVMPLLILLEKHCHKRKLQVQISLLRLSSFIAASLDHLMNARTHAPLLKKIIYYVRYDKRSDYKNFNESFYLKLGWRIWCEETPTTREMMLLNSNQKSEKIALNNFKDGIYYYRIQCNIEIIGQGKLVIIK